MANHYRLQDNFFPIGLVFLLDVLLTAFSFVLSYALCSIILPDLTSHSMLIQLPIIVALTSLIFLYIGIYKGFVKTDRLREVYSIFNAICLANILTIVLVVINGKLIMEENLMVPLSIIIVHSILSFSALVASRWLYKRIIIRMRSSYQKAVRAVFFHEEASSAEQVLFMKEAFGEKGLEITQSIPYKQNGFSKEMVASTLSAIPFDQVILCTSKQTTPSVMQGLLSYCVQADKPLKLIDSFEEHHDVAEPNALVFGTKVLRPFDVKDLFPPQVNLHNQYHKLFTGLSGKTILITGAGGCIGTAFAKELFRLGVNARLILLDNSESALNNVYSFMQNSMHLEVIPKLNDVKDKKGLKDIFSTYAPSIVLHTAGNNGPEPLDNNINKLLQENVMATKLLADLAKESGVDRFIFCSNKNIDVPTTTLEVCKSLTELYLQSLDNENNGTTYVSVRLPNLYESGSSVVHYMQSQFLFGKAIDRSLFKETEVLASTDDVAKSLIWLTVGEPFSKNQIIDLHVGSAVPITLLAQTLRLKDQWVGGRAKRKGMPSFEGEFKEKMPDAKPKVNVYHPGSIDGLFSKVEPKTFSLRPEQVQQKIENVCLNILFYNDDYSPIFELIGNFGAGQWRNLHKLHLGKKTPNKIIKLQTN